MLCSVRVKLDTALNSNTLLFEAAVEAAEIDVCLRVFQHPIGKSGTPKILFLQLFFTILSFSSSPADIRG